MAKFININYPFKNSPKGFFLDLTTNDSAAIKSDLMHLILTRKGQRLYNPQFGTDLLKFIFEPNDNLTFTKIREEIDTAVAKYIPNLKITELAINYLEESEHAVSVRIDYEITDDVFTETDFLIINI